MLTIQNFPLHKKQLSHLVFDYVSRKAELKPFYNYFCDRKGLKLFLSEKNLFTGTNRKALMEVLKTPPRLVNNTSSTTQKNIKLLEDKKTFTVTTGHQLCLFTGPLYFIYKIFSAINLCEKLKEEFPAYNFVPVYWMATEDHDAAEINHFNLFGKKLQWDTEQSGAVGNFNVEGLDAIYEQLEAIAGDNENAEILLALFEKSYLKTDTLAEATHYLVNELFGEYGLVVVDGNSPELKKLFKSYFRKDILENTPYKKVTDSIAKLASLGYEAQVNAREINCFYMEAGLRARIEKEGNDYKVAGTEKRFSRKEMEDLIENEPEKISPNVVLRPCYQQFILPNIAYVGGPGELAYWLEYKSMFDELELIFPVLMPRKMVSILDNTMMSKLEKLELGPEETFEEEHDLVMKFMERTNKAFQVEEYKIKLEELFSELTGEVSAIDKTLAGAVDAEKQKSVNAINGIMTKVNKAIKLRSETEVNQVKTIKSKLFPDGVPQERVENFSAYFLKWGEEFMTFLKENLDYDLENLEQVFVVEE